MLIMHIGFLACFHALSLERNRFRKITTLYTLHFLLNTNLHYNVPLKFPNVMQNVPLPMIGLTGCELGMTGLANDIVVCFHI